MFYREQRWRSRKTKNLKVKESLEFLDVRIFPITEKEKNRSRKEKSKVTAPKQQKLNNKRSIEWHKKIIHSNFDESDYVIHATFDNKNRPNDKIAIEKEFKNYIARINRRRKKLGLGNTKYVAVIEGIEDKRKKVHFHIIIDGELDRDTLEELWNKKGYINVDRLQMNEEGFTALVKYMAKEKETEEMKYNKMWRSSVGLKKPKLEVNDCKYNKRKMKNMLMKQPSRQELEAMYPGWTLTNYEIKYNEEYGNIYMDINMRRYCKNEKIPGTKLFKARRN